MCKFVVYPKSSRIHPVENPTNILRKFSKIKSFEIKMIILEKFEITYYYYSEQNNK